MRPGGLPSLAQTVQKRESWQKYIGCLLEHDKKSFPRAKLIAITMRAAINTPYDHAVESRQKSGITAADNCGYRVEWG